MKTFMVFTTLYEYEIESGSYIVKAEKIEDITEDYMKSLGWIPGTIECKHCNECSGKFEQIHNVIEIGHLDFQKITEPVSE